MRLERRLRHKTAIDMTPLIDVIMQLIIFFMITTTFKTVPGIELALPSSTTARPVPQENLRLLVVSEDDITVGSTKTRLADLDIALPAAIKAMQSPVESASSGAGNASAVTGGPGAGAAKPGAAGADGAAAAKPEAPKAVVEGAKDIDYQLLVSVLDALRRNGIESVGLATLTAETPGKAAR